jgi:hypothetical protein
MEIVKGFLSREDVEVVANYIATIKFNTKDEHVPLHDKLYTEYNAQFDLHTRGEMPDYILQIFSKYSKAFYEIIESRFPGEYLPPMFSKHYIARYMVGAETGPQFDNTKPKGTYKSIIFWNNDFDGGNLVFPKLEKTVKPEPGDLVFFEEGEENMCAITKILSKPLYFSEAWIGKKGQLWMPSNEPYEKVQWDNWEIKGF